MVIEDHDLISRAQQGNSRAFEQLVYRYDKRVLSMALSFTNNQDEAKDIYQEVFVRVFRALPKFQFRSQFSTWLYRIVTNVCLTHQSRSKAHTFVGIDDEYTDEDTGRASETLVEERLADEHVVNEEITTHVREAMNGLSPQQRVVFTLRHYEGYKLREIASMMDCAEGTVKKYLFTATERMRDQLRVVYQ
ncbi:MAG: sigma-70 family RNA polymerase sigma factor [Candidatus Latescibacteria bacterium]|nr:sigma-70 family RNA polymerase sigma factor [Candidatus Latescibacterota bacterium]